MNNTIDKQQRPKIILIRGLPGSGKTHVARALQKALGANDVVLLDPDAIDFESSVYKEHVQAATAEGVDPKLHAYRFLRAQAYRGIAERKTIIWNQPFTNLEIFNKMVTNLRLEASKNNTEINLIVVEVAVDPEIAKRRVMDRKKRGGHGPSDATFERFIADYSSFAPHGYKTVAVQGDVNVTESVRRILAALETEGSS